MRAAHAYNDTGNRFAGASMTAPAISDLISISPSVRQSIRTLVIDDERVMRDSCASVLTAEGYHVTTAGRGVEALDPTPRRRDVITFRGEHAGAAVAHHALVIDYESANALADRWRDGDEIADGGRRHGRPSESVAGVIVRMCRTHGVAAPATSSCSILDRRHAAQRYNPQFRTQETGSRVVCQDSHGACNDSQVVTDT